MRMASQVFEMCPNTMLAFQLLKRSANFRSETMMLQSAEHGHCLGLFRHFAGNHCIADLDYCSFRHHKLRKPIRRHQNKAEHFFFFIFVYCWKKIRENVCEFIFEFTKTVSHSKKHHDAQIQLAAATVHYSNFNVRSGINWRN